MFRAKISIFFEKNHIFRFFSIFLRRGSSRTSTNLLNDSKIRVWGLSFYCGTQLHGSQAPSALTLYIKFTISKVQIFEILNKIDLGSIVVGSRIEGTVQKMQMIRIGSHRPSPSRGIHISAPPEPIWPVSRPARPSGPG